MWILDRMDGSLLSGKTFSRGTGTLAGDSSGSIGRRCDSTSHRLPDKTHNMEIIFLS